MMVRMTKSQLGSEFGRPQGRNPGSNGVGLPASHGDTRPDPALLTPAEPLAEFGRLMLRAVERRHAGRLLK